MSSIFSSNRLFPSFKRSSHSRTKPDTSKAKAKPLDILPDLSEEDETRLSRNSTSSFESSPLFNRSFSAAALSSRLSMSEAERKRDSRRVVLTGAEGLTFDDFFPMSSAPSPPPPVRKPSPMSESPLDSIDLRFSGLGFSLDFPSPPSSPPQRRGHSPAPSVSSSYTNTSRSSMSSMASSSSSRRVDSTPPTSDDESHPRLSRAPTLKSQRASIMFMKSMPDLKVVPPINECEEDVDDDAQWFAQDISDVITLTSPLPPSFPSSLVPPSPTTDAPARPESIVVPPRLQGKPQHQLQPGIPRIWVNGQASPSAQLDPTFPLRRKSFLIPDRPPPPPPIRIECCSSMEDETDELLHELASAALCTGFLGTGLAAIFDGHSAAASSPSTPSSAFIVQPRPLPRSSIPADVFEQSEVPFIPGLEDVLELELTGESPPATPNSVSTYSEDSFMGDSFPMSPALSFEFMADNHASPASAGTRSSPRDPLPERNLRSRWSSSTLGSMAEHQEPSAASWMPRFHLHSSKKGKGKAPAMKMPPPMSPALRRSFELEMELERRDSRGSGMSDGGHSDSGESTTSASSGLRRKPIPVEIFMR